MLKKNLALLFLFSGCFFIVAQPGKKDVVKKVIGKINKKQETTNLKQKENVTKQEVVEYCVCTKRYYTYAVEQDSSNDWFPGYAPRTR